MPLDSILAKILWNDPLLHFNSAAEEYLNTLPALTFLFWVDNKAENTIILSLNTVHSDWHSPPPMRFTLHVSLHENQLHIICSELHAQTYLSLDAIVKDHPKKLLRSLLNKDVPEKIKNHPFYHPTLLPAEARFLLQKKSSGSSLFLSSTRPGCIELLSVENREGELSYYTKRFLITVDDKLEFLIRNRHRRIVFNTLEEIVTHFKLINPVSIKLSFKTNPEYIMKRSDKINNSFKTLPETMVMEIFNWLDYRDLHTTKFVNTSWYFFSKNKLATFTDMPQFELTKQIMKKRIYTILTAEKVRYLISNHLVTECSIHAYKVFLGYHKPNFKTADPILQCKLFNPSKYLEKNIDNVIRIDINVENDPALLYLGYLQFTIKENKFALEHNLDFWKGLSENFLLDKILFILETMEPLLKPTLENEVSPAPMIR